jgi:CheY-like chemotaxis protein
LKWAETPAVVTDQPRILRRSVIPGRILVVEDVEINQEIVRAVLAKAGHSVDVVPNGIAAIRAVQENPYELVLMDVHMPDMDGTEATKRIRELRHPARAVPIIAVTANIMPQQIAAFRQVGMNDHVGKPFRRDELLQVVDRWLGEIGVIGGAS